MASDDVVPDHTSSDEQVETKGNEELKTVEQRAIPPSTEDNVIEGEEKAKAEEFVNVKAPLESKEVANMQILPPAVSEAEKVEKFDETPNSDVPVTKGSQVGASPDSNLDISSVPDSVEAVGKEPEESSKIPDVTESSIEALDKPVELLEYPTKDSEPGVGKKPEVYVEEPKTVEKPESVVVVKVESQEQSEEVEEKYLALEKPESVVEVGGKPQEAEEGEEKSEMLKPGESIDNDSGKDGATQTEKSLNEETSVVEPKTLEMSESVIEMGGKPQEQAEEVEKKSGMLDPKESLDSDITKDDLTDIVKDDMKPLKEEEVTKGQGPVASESDVDVSASQGAESGLKEDGKKSVTPDVENVSVDDTKKEVGVDGGKAAVQVGDVEAKKEEKVVNMEEGKDNYVKTEEVTRPEQTEATEEKEAKDMKIDEKEENSVEKEELIPLEPTETKYVGGSYTAAEVTGKYSDLQRASKDSEIATEEKKERDAKVDALDLKGKVDVVESSNAVNEPASSESKESESEGKVEEAMQSYVDNLDKGVAVEDTAKSGAPDVELSKIEDNSKTDQEPPKREAPTKPTQKQSGNIISKVKQSFVKVKKAIIGKSPNSKTLSSESKDGIQTK